MSDQINLRLPSVARDRLDAAAKARGLTRKELLRWGAGVAIMIHEAEERGARIVIREQEGAEQAITLPV